MVLRFAHPSRPQRAFANLLVRYINQGRGEANHASLSPRKVTGLLTRRHPDRLDDKQRALRDQLAGACPEMTVLADQIRTFASLLVPSVGNAEHLTAWIARTRAADLPFLYSFATAAYVHRRSADWLKLKCSGGQEFVTGGFTEPSGSRIGFDALLLGHHDEDRRLPYAGKVGTGFDTDTLRKLRGGGTYPSAVRARMPAHTQQRLRAHGVVPVQPFTGDIR